MLWGCFGSNSRRPRGGKASLAHLLGLQPNGDKLGAPVRGWVTLTSRRNQAKLKRIGNGRGDQSMVRNLLFVGIVACGEDKDRESAARTSAEMADDAADTGSWGGGGAEDSAYQATPEAWTLSGELVVENGLLSAEGSTVTAEVVDALGAVICHEDARVSSSARVVELPDDDVEAWWSILLESGDADSCETAGVQSASESLSLGLGPLHPEVVAVLDSEAGEAPRTRTMRRVSSRRLMEAMSASVGDHEARARSRDAFGGYRTVWCVRWPLAVSGGLSVSLLSEARSQYTRFFAVPPVRVDGAWAISTVCDDVRDAGHQRVVGDGCVEHRSIL